MVVHPRIRTHHARHGRTTDGMRRVLADAGPRFAPGPDLADGFVLEVGCGNGDAALAFAAAHPGTTTVALDVHVAGVVQLLRRLDDGGVPNVRTAVADAVDFLDDAVRPGALGGVHLFFPDPWPKARHHKRRFVRADVLDLLADRCAPGAEILVATDHAGYARAAQAALDAHPAFTGGPGTRPPWRPTTRYEQRAADAGRTVTELAFRRC